MARGESYNTKQKSLILDAVKKQKKDFTIKDIHIVLNKKVGLTTIYRFIDKLVDDGVLSKFIRNDNMTYYQYLEHCDEENHFYLRCEQCGKMEHVDCECIGDLSSHIFKKHHFKANRENIIINGLCDNCTKSL